MCVFDDVIEHSGGHSIKYKDFFIPLLRDGLQSNHAEIRQAAAYGWGVLGKFGGEVYAQTCSGKSPNSFQLISIESSFSFFLSFVRMFATNGAAGECAGRTQRRQY